MCLCITDTMNRRQVKMLQNLNQFVVPKCEGRTFTLRRGQTLRIIETEGPQAADLIAFNLHNWKDSSGAWLTRILNDGSYTRVTKLYSKLPEGNLMFTYLNPLEGVIWLDEGRCNRFVYGKLGVKGYHKNCQDILAECIKPYGMTPYDVPEVFNIFMTAVHHEDGSYELKQSPVNKGDYVDLRAEMDLLCAISACPHDLGVFNAFKVKSIGVQIFD